MSLHLATCLRHSPEERSVFTPHRLISSLKERRFGCLILVLSFSMSKSLSKATKQSARNHMMVKTRLTEDNQSLPAKLQVLEFV